MSIYAKLAKARVQLQNAGLKKSGKNNFSNYDYFELSDFLPKINEIFAELGLCSVISFNREFATLTLFDAESEGKIEFTSPMATASLKGCHEIQNLGAVETYQRRYLYMTALEIVANDVLDENTGNDKTTPKPKSKPSSNNSAPQNMTSTPAATQGQKKNFEEFIRERLIKYETKEQLQANYDKFEQWVKEKYPDRFDEFAALYDEAMFNLSI